MYHWLIIVCFILLGMYSKQQSIEAFGGTEVIDIQCPIKVDCEQYPRYKRWWRNIRDVRTRPPYDQIFPPYWNIHWNPNITSDEYYARSDFWRGSP